MVINAWAGFVVGMAGWLFILYEIFMGEAGSVAGEQKSEAVRSAFGTMRFIVSIGWSIYPLGYFFGYLMGAVSDDPLNLIYNVADFVNKIWFCLAIKCSEERNHGTDGRQRRERASDLLRAMTEHFATPW